MGTYSKIILSGSTDGKGITITGNAPSVGNTLHTAITGAENSIDEVFIYAHNLVTTSSEIILTIAEGSKIRHTLPAGNLNGLVLIYPGLPLKNSNALVASATLTGIVRCFGYVNRYVS